MTTTRTSGLDSWHIRIVILVAAVLVVLPSLQLGFFSDDYLFVTTLEGSGHWRPPAWDLYNFIPGPPRVGRMLADGDLPWWAADGLKLHLVRPLTSGLLVLDHALFGRWAMGYHLHSSLWWVLLVALVRRFFFENFPQRVAALASLIFVFSGAHGMVHAWIACRHLLVAGCFGVIAILLLQRALSARQPWLGLGVATSLAVALSASEAALGVVPFLVFAGTRGPAEAAPQAWQIRVGLLAAPLGITAAYFVAYRLVGGGSTGGGTYVDPLSSPVRFATLAAVRLPMLLATAILGVPVEASTTVGNGAFVALGVLAAATLFGLARSVWPAVPTETRAVFRWLLPAAVLAMVVGLGGIPGSRQLVLPNLFFAPLVACLVLFGVPKHVDSARGPRLVRRVSAGLLAFLHVPLAILIGVAGVAGMKQMRAGVLDIATSAVLDAPSRFFVLGTSDPLIGMYTPLVHLVEKGRPLRCWSMLAMTKANTLVERTGDATIAFEIEGGNMLTNPFETLAWDPAVPMQVGHERTQCGATIRVLATRDGRPSRVQATFDQSLDHDSVTVLQWRGRRLVPLRLLVGEKTRLVWEPGPMGLL